MFKLFNHILSCHCLMDGFRCHILLYFLTIGLIIDFANIFARALRKRKEGWVECFLRRLHEDEPTLSCGADHYDMHTSTRLIGDDTFYPAAGLLEIRSCSISGRESMREEEIGRTPVEGSGCLYSISLGSFKLLTSGCFKSISVLNRDMKGDFLKA